MTLRFSLILFISLVIATTFDAAAQGNKGNTDTAQATDELRLQLLEVEAKESQLKSRARQLDEDLKPDNIDRYFAGVGSTRPEELRELRRRQLNIERERVQAQLKLVATSRERLESVLRVAETRAYQESAEQTAAPLQMLRGSFATAPRAVVTVLAGLIAILVIGFGIAGVARKLNRA